MIIPPAIKCATLIGSGINDLVHVNFKISFAFFRVIPFLWMYIFPICSTGPAFWISLYFLCLFIFFKVSCIFLKLGYFLITTMTGIFVFLFSSWMSITLNPANAMPLRRMHLSWGLNLDLLIIWINFFVELLPSTATFVVRMPSNNVPPLNIVPITMILPFLNFLNGESSIPNILISLLYIFIFNSQPLNID